MKKLLIAAAAVTMLVGPVTARAQDTMGGLGFRTLSDPGGDLLASFTGISFNTTPAVGIRQWFTPKLGVDLAVGFSTLKLEQGPPSTTTDEATGFAVDLGVPVSVKKWDKVNFIFRPGFLFSRAKVEDKLDLTPPNEIKATGMSISGELEVEYMLVDNVSISASHGIAYNSVKLRDNDTPESELDATGFGTSGNNFTQLGFHVYLW